ncbi:MAG: hypothetical protein AABZ60_13265 [Planctomycetota bacterium]
MFFFKGVRVEMKIALILILGFFCSALRAQPGKDWNEFQPKNKIFTIPYPADWSVQEIAQTQSVDFIFTATEESSEIGTKGFTISCELLPSLAKQLALDKYLPYLRQKRKEILLKENPEIKVSQEFSLSIAQHPSLGLLFEGKLATVLGNSSGGQIVYRDENFLYVFRCWSKNTEWETYRPVYLSMLERFQPSYKMTISQPDPSVSKIPTPLPSVETPPVVPEKPTRTIRYFCYSLTVPTDWKESSENYYLLQFLVPRELVKGTLTPVPFIGEFQVGTIQDPQKALQWWLSTQMRPLATYSFMDPEKKPVSSKVASFNQWKEENGYQIASIVIEEFHDSKTCKDKSCNHILSKLFGFLSWNSDCVFFTGSAFGGTSAYWRYSPEEQSTIFKHFFELGKEHLQVVKQVQFNLPQLQPEWTSWLIRKKSYRYFYEWSTGGPSGMWVVSNKETSWSFLPDQTCELVSDSYFSASNTFHDNPLNSSDITGFMNSTTEGNNQKDQGKNRFEVRGASAQDLWLVVYHKTGRSTFHRLEPKTKKKWSIYEPEGLAIDDQIEGTYESGDGYEIYHSSSK